jgi:hypothetical protein
MQLFANETQYRLVAAPVVSHLNPINEKRAAPIQPAAGIFMSERPHSTLQSTNGAVPSISSRIDTSEMCLVLRAGFALSAVVTSASILCTLLATLQYRCSNREIHRFFFISFKYHHYS